VHTLQLGRVSQVITSFTNYRINVSAAVTSIPPAYLRDLALRDPARAARDAALEDVLAAPVQPEHRAEAAVVSPCELYRQLRLTYPAEAT